MSEQEQEQANNSVMSPSDAASTQRVRRYNVTEIFGPTIQGEGIVAGTKTMFIRFAGCDYRCEKCDSLHAVIPEAIKKSSTMMTADEIMVPLFAAKVASGVEWVTLSGGNPCMWEISDLCTMLKLADFKISLETQGTLIPKWLGACDVVTISPKSPGMGEKFEPAKFEKFLQMCTVTSPGTVSLKVVIFSNQDLEFALEVRELFRKYYKYSAIYLSLGNPYPPKLDDEFNMVEDVPDRAEGWDLRLELLKDYEVLAEEICQDPRFTDFRFLPQLHVLVWQNKARV